MELLLGIVVPVVLLILLLTVCKVVVPTNHEYVVERLGKYRCTLEAGYHILFPLLDKIAYKRSLKEEFLDLDKQSCVTADNVTVEVDSAIFLQVVNSRQSAYAVEDYSAALEQLAHASLCSAIGKVSWDTIMFVSKAEVNRQVAEALILAAQNWGVKVTRYEIKQIRPIKEA